jgi:hypothetical protein
MLTGSLQIKILRLPFLNGQSALWADCQAGPKAVAEAVADDLCLAAFQLNGPFCTGSNAFPAAGAA